MGPDVMIFPGGSEVKVSACNVGDLDSILEHNEDFNEKANEIQIEIQSLVNSNVPVLVS